MWLLFSDASHAALKETGDEIDPTGADVDGVADGRMRALTGDDGADGAPGNAAPTADNAVLLTVFFKHDQSRPLGELNAQLDKQGFRKAFPPAGVEVVSWYVMMGIGQIVTLRLPASRLREVNRIIEDTAWGPYRTEFYPTYDYKAVGMAEHEKATAN